MTAQLLVGALVVCLCIGVVSDIRDRRVPNWLVLVMLSVGLAGALTGASSAVSLSDALFGCLVGLSLWLPFWMLGMLGAGDVKYFAAASLWLGVSLSWRASLLAALLGGVMGFAVLVYRRGAREAAAGVALQAKHPGVILAEANAGQADAKARTFPYALPMAIAIAVAMFAPQLVQSQ